MKTYEDRKERETKGKYKKLGIEERNEHQKDGANFRRVFWLTLRTPYKVDVDMDRVEAYVKTDLEALYGYLGEDVSERTIDNIKGHSDDETALRKRIEDVGGVATYGRLTLLSEKREFWDVKVREARP